MTRFLLPLALLLLAAYPASAQTPIPVKIVVVTMFELGEDTGDQPGEFQNWVERLPLKETIPFPQGYRPLRYNAEKGVLGVVTGIGTAKAAATIMALGTDPRFDLRKAYWLVAGISGVDPADMSLGSAAWADWLVDGDLAYEIDVREVPPDWPTGYIPLRRSKPYEQPVSADNEGAVYRLNAALTDWAYRTTREMPLGDHESLQVLRKRYTGYPAAQRPPFVLKGENLASSTFWHGARLTEWANEWVRYWTGGKGNFTTSAMEDTGTAQSLTFLARAGLVDFGRLMVLRTASNYTMPHEGITAAQSLSGEKRGSYSGYIPALDAAYRVGARIVDEITENWAKYADAPPPVR